MLMTRIEETIYENEALRNIMFDVVGKLAGIAAPFSVTIDTGVLCGLPVYSLPKLDVKAKSLTVKIDAKEGSFWATVGESETPLPCNELVHLLNKASSIGMLWRAI